MTSGVIAGVVVARGERMVSCDGMSDLAVIVSGS